MGLHIGVRSGRRMRLRSLWLPGLGVGLAAAVAGGLALLIAGAVSGRGLGILADAGQATLPTFFRSATHAPSAMAYLVVHTAIYMVAGVAALAFVRLADRIPAVATAAVFVVIILELGFLMLTSVTRELGAVDEATWRALLVSHAVADVVFALGVVVVHPAIRRDFSAGYEGKGE